MENRRVKDHEPSDDAGTSRDSWRTIFHTTIKVALDSPSIAPYIFSSTWSYSRCVARTEWPTRPTDGIEPDVSAALVVVVSPIIRLRRDSTARDSDENKRAKDTKISERIMNLRKKKKSSIPFSCSAVATPSPRAWNSRWTTDCRRAERALGVARCAVVSQVNVVATERARGRDSRAPRKRDSHTGGHPASSARCPGPRECGTRPREKRRLKKKNSITKKIKIHTDTPFSARR